MYPHPWIAIIGRPNVGKSTLFNRFIGSRKAVISPVRGTTRDRLYGRATWRGVGLTFIDTGGLELAAADGLSAAVQRHIRRALEEADVLLLICDAREDLVPSDQLILDRLRPLGKPIVLAVNKLDAQAHVPAEFFTLGLPEVFPISALHGRGIGELLDGLVERVGARPGEPTGAAAGQPAPFAIAVVGRPNVGKSSLVNAWLQDERVIVSDAPGTTRDAIDTPLVVGGRSVVLVDTAGLRHRRKVKQPLDLFSMSRAIEAIERSDVAVVLLDAREGVARDDKRILARVCDAGRGLVVAVNKWDLMATTPRPNLARRVQQALPMASFAPVVPVSAKTGFHVQRLLGTALRVAQAVRQGLSDADCASLIQKAWRAAAPPRVRGRTIQLRAARWRAGHSASVELVTRPSGALPRAYQHYLLNAIHAHPRLAGVPVRLVVRGP